MLAARQAHIGFEPGGPDGCDGERLPGERADGTVGFQDGAGQAGVSAGLCGFAEYSVGEEGFRSYAGRPGPAAVEVVLGWFSCWVCGWVEQAAGGGREYVVILVDLDGDAQGGDPGGAADWLPEGLELPVLLGIEGHGGQLPALGIDYRGGGDGLVDQVAAGQEPAAGCGVGGDQVEELSGTPAQDQCGAAVVLPACYMDAVVRADLAGGSVSGRDQLGEFCAVAHREPDAGQVGSHAITIRIKRALPYGIYTPGAAQKPGRIWGTPR